MAKVVYNVDYGGFNLSDAAIRLGQELSGDDQWGIDPWVRDIPRHDHVLVGVVEMLGDKAHSGEHDMLDIREIPDGSLYRIDEYDGRERVVLQSEYKWEIAS